MFFENFEKRLNHWHDFRANLETVELPIQKTLDFWNKAPIVNRTCDPFDQTTWLDPWQLIETNNYCNFSKILAIYYTLALTERFKESFFEIQVAQDREQQELYYLLIVDNFVIGYDFFNVIARKDLPKNLLIQNSYTMRPSAIS